MEKLLDKDNEKNVCKNIFMIAYYNTMNWA